MTFGKNSMNFKKLATLSYLIFAPAFLLYLRFGEIDQDSFFYMSAKMIPSLISLFVVFLFLAAVLGEKSLTLTLTKRFYKKELNEKEVEFLSKSDIYWFFVTLLNSAILIYMALYVSNELWATYSSVGWYLYLFFALSLQILYGVVKKINKA